MKLIMALKFVLGDFTLKHGRMARDGHGFPMVSLGPIVPNPSTPCGQAIPVTAISGVARPQGGQPVAVFYPFGHPTLYANFLKLIILI
jgi:hypothetical protein